MLKIDQKASVMLSMVLNGAVAAVVTAKDGNCPEDLKCGDMSKDDLRALDWISWVDFSGRTPEEHMVSWKGMCTSLFSTGELENVILDMIDHYPD